MCLRDMRGQRRPKLDCADAQYHPDLSTQFIHSVVPNESVSGQRRPCSDYADAQYHLGLCSPIIHSVASNDCKRTAKAQYQTASVLLEYNKLTNIMFRTMNDQN